MIWNIKNNKEIKELLQKYELSYRDILPYIKNFSHTNRISEELSNNLSPERKALYLQAIEQARLKKIRKLTDKGG